MRGAEFEPKDGGCVRGSPELTLGGWMTCVRCREKLALEALRCADWNVESAIEMFYSGDIPSLRPVVDLKALEAMYKKYKDKHQDLIMAEGVGQFCEDLGVDPSDIVMLVLSYHLNAQTMCEYTHDEFVNGLAKLGLDSIRKIKDKLPRMRAELEDPNSFREIYAYAFLFSREKGQKSVMLDVAIEMWHLLFPDGQWPLLDDWCEYLRTHHNKAVSRDTWVQLLEFVKLGDDLSSYDPSGAWPFLIDEFVEYKQGGGSVP